MVQEREMSAGDRTHDARQRLLMRRYWIGVAFFLIPLILLVCLVSFFRSGNPVAFWNLLSLLGPFVILWETRYTLSKKLYQRDLRRLENRLDKE